MQISWMNNSNTLFIFDGVHTELVIIYYFANKFNKCIFLDPLTFYF